MASQITCECGYVAQAETDADVVADIREHMRTDHPEILDRVTDEEILDWIEVA